MAETLLLTNEALAALQGRQVIVTLAESGEDQHGKLATVSADWLELANAIGHTFRLYRHAIGAVRVA